MIALLFLLGFIGAYMVLFGYAERKLAAFIQDRLGPNLVGPQGVLQFVADAVKLLQKEDVVPASADRRLFLLAPILIFVAVFSGFAVVPLAAGVIGSGAQVGVFYLMAIVSLDVVGILLAGWASNGKFSLYGAMRAVSQMVSYEIPLGLSVLCVAMVCQTLDLQAISFQQGAFVNRYPSESETVNYLFGLQALGVDVTLTGGFLTWNVVRMPFLIFGFLIFFVAALAEANRAPFDLPEAESELVAGHMTEYSGFRWAIIMLGEYTMMLLASLLAAILFFGSWNSPLPNVGSLALYDWTTGQPGTIAGALLGGFWLFSKALLLVLVKMWVRWTYPRLRVDQLMSLCWKYLTPFALGLLFLCGVWRLLMV